MSSPDEFGYSLVELADQTGLSPRTIHYYSAQALLPSADRRGAGARYPRLTLDRLRAIQSFKSQVRLTLQEIRRVLGTLSAEQIRAISTGELSPWEVLDRPVPPPPHPSSVSRRPEPGTGGRGEPDARSGSRPGHEPAALAPPAGSAASAAFADGERSAGFAPPPGPRDAVAVVGGEASSQLASLLRTLDSRAGRPVPRAGSRDHWLSIPITADLQISAHRVSGEDIDILRRIADHLRALLVQGFAGNRPGAGPEPAAAPGNGARSEVATTPRRTEQPRGELESDGRGQAREGDRRSGAGQGPGSFTTPGS